MTALSKYKTYPEYKDSGVEWLGEIPSNWIVSTLKYRAKFITGLTPSTQIESYYSDEPTIYQWIRPEDIIDGSINTQSSKFLSKLGWEIPRKIPTESILVCCIGTIGKLSYLNVTATTNQQITSVIPHNNSKYYFYLLLAAKKELEDMATGNVVKILNSERLGKLKITLASSLEQTKIAQFLDHETAKIDQLIEKQQSLIELLKEKRQAVISHAVTKGLDPNAKMKNSGVEWLGEVPEHWQLLKATYLGKLFGSETILESDIKEEGCIPFLKVSNLSLNSFDLESKSFFIGKNKINSISPRKNYIVFPKRGAAIFTNKVNIVRENSLLDPNLMGWKINQNAIPEYIAFLLKLRRLDDIADISTVPQINNKHIEPQKFPIPPILEQQQIIDFLDNQISRFDLLTQKAEEQIELMKERRMALISAAVTGKIDVRDWQPKQ